MVPPIEQTAPKPQKKLEIGRGKQSGQKHNINQRGDGEVGTGQTGKTNQTTKIINPIGGNHKCSVSHRSEQKRNTNYRGKRENRDKANERKPNQPTKPR